MVEVAGSADEKIGFSDFEWEIKMANQMLESVSQPCQLPSQPFYVYVIGLPPDSHILFCSQVHVCLIVYMVKVQ